VRVLLPLLHHRSTGLSFESQLLLADERLRRSERQARLLLL
jgi:hypothetical protein